MANIVVSEEMARLKAERDMRELARKLGMPPGMPQTFYCIPVKKDGKTEYIGKWGKYGLLWLAHQLGNLVVVECRNMARSKQNGGLATAYCKLVYSDGRMSIEEGEADIQERNIQSNPGGPYKQADTMARVRALEHAIVNITGNGTRLMMERPIDTPVIYEMKDAEDRDNTTTIPRHTPGTEVHG